MVCLWRLSLWSSPRYWRCFDGACLLARSPQLSAKHCPTNWEDVISFRRRLQFSREAYYTLYLSNWTEHSVELVRYTPWAVALLDPGCQVIFLVQAVLWPGNKLSSTFFDDCAIVMSCAIFEYCAKTSLFPPLIWPWFPECPMVYSVHCVNNCTFAPSLIFSWNFLWSRQIPQAKSPFCTEW